MSRFNGTVAGFDTHEFLIFLVVPLALFISTCVDSFRFLRWRRLIQDMPTSRTRSAPQGYVELAGKARLIPGPEIFTPMSRRPCVWWSLVVEEQERDSWRVVSSEVSDELFHIDDDVGTCIVDPEGADVAAPHTSTKRTGVIRGRRRKTTEQYIKPGDHLYVIGWHRTFSSAANWDHEAELIEKIREWKRDQDQLLRRFDTNRDGKVDQKEWELAHKEARKEVAAEHREASVTPGVNVIGAPEDARPFLIAAEQEDLVARRLWRRTAGTLSISVISGLIVILMITARF